MLEAQIPTMTRCCRANVGEAGPSNIGFPQQRRAPERWMSAECRPWSAHVRADFLLAELASGLRAQQKPDTK